MNVPLWSVILVSVVTAVIFGLILVIFGRNEKEITHRVAHLYPVSDPQFLRSMGVLLGPALVRGNRVETLLRIRDAIFMERGFSNPRQIADKNVRAPWSP